MSEAGPTALNLSEDDLTNFGLGLPKLIRNRVFLNNVDTFTGKHVSSLIVEETLEEKPEEIELVGEEEEIEEEDFLSVVKTEKDLPAKFEVVGTTKENDYQKSEDVLLVLDKNSPDFYKDIFNCAFIIIDITNDPDEIALAHSILNALDKMMEEVRFRAPKTFERTKDKRVFILISTVMTWAKTKPVDPEDPELPFTEADYKKRKPHPNYKAHIALEKETTMLGRKYKNCLTTYVVASGVIYGYEEEDLHFLFRAAWNNLPELPIIDNGRNCLPVVHIIDLTAILSTLCKTVPTKKYIFAVEPNILTQGKMVRTISKALGYGKVKNIPKEDAFLITDMTQAYYDLLTVNLRMEPGVAISDMEIQWHLDLGFAESAPTLAQEFRKYRRLLPVKVMVLGPPASGKTTLCRKLCDMYRLPYISKKVVVEEALDKLRSEIDSYQQKILERERKLEEMQLLEEEVVEEEEVEEEEEEEEDLVVKVEELSAQLANFLALQEQSPDGSLPDSNIIEFIKAKLRSPPCQNQGYVIDGYPTLPAQALEIFGFSPDDGSEVDEEVEDEEGDENPSQTVIPELIISLEATDEFLVERVIKLDEDVVQAMGYEEEKFVEKMAKFRDENTEETTVLNVFDEREIHPMLVDIATIDAFEVAVERLGPFRGYPPSKEELAAAALLLSEEERLLREAEEERRLEEERLAKEEMCRKREEWTNIQQLLQDEDHKQQALRTKPMRKYLMQNVFPMLSRGLIELTRIRPSDPVDFLAEYLFKENPEGRMFDPSFLAAYEELLETIEQFQEKLNDAPGQPTEED